jgi:hypothetical protein
LTWDGYEKEVILTWEGGRGFERNPDRHCQQSELNDRGNQQVGAVRGLNCDTWWSAHKQQLVGAVDSAVRYTETELFMSSRSLPLSEDKKAEKVRELGAEGNT